MCGGLKVKFTISKTKFSKFQRLACLCTTAALRTAHTTAIEVLLRILSAYLQLEADGRV
jgi:hypothetical protein